ncbi:MAG: FGGY-family carbohydrate kinase [Anaerolineae bacterium]
MTLLGLDIGTTHCKAGLFARDGTALKIASRPTVTRKAPGGWSYYDPEELLRVVTTTVQDAIQDVREPIAAIGIASMAETGLLIDRRTGEPRSPMVPWFDPVSQPQADRIAASSDPQELYKRFGLRLSFKPSLVKLLWLRESQGTTSDDAIWLSAADYVLYRLTGAWGTDFSLASRTLAFRVDEKRWDDAWLREWGFSADLFPPVSLGGSVMGKTTGAAFGLPEGIPVSVSGHDHVCAALAVGATQPGVVFDSMGTAEALVGALPARPLTDEDYRIGLHYGCHVVDGCGYWMGGLSTSGGAVDWLRSLLGEAHLSHEAIGTLLDAAPAEPTGILFFPYLLGSGSPHSDPKVRSAFIGLDASHGASDLLKALVEGVAYEIEVVRRAGERMARAPIETLVVAGGGSRYRAWLQIKADVSGCRIRALAQPEATLLGAALAAGIGCGVYRDEAEALAGLDQPVAGVYSPDPARHEAYADVFEYGYLAFQEPLRRYRPSRQR